MQSSIIAIIVPEIEAVKSYAAIRKIPNDSFSFLCNQPQIINLLKTELDKISRQENLKDIEMVSIEIVYFIKVPKYFTKI